MKLAFGSYGHNPSGKVYAYWVPEDARAGQNFNAPVMHYKTKKTFDTMFTVTNIPREPYATEEADRIFRNVGYIWNVNGANILDLPGAQEYKDKSRYPNLNSEAAMKGAWTKNSNMLRRLLLTKRGIL